MSRPDFPLTILDFQQRFGSEESCRAYLFESRWPEGFVCPVCGAGEVGAETRRHLWICIACGRQTSITAGTVMHKTRLPLRTWFWAADLISTFHPGISAKQLQRQLGIGSHETAWAMLHKLRGAMVAPERAPLKDEVEIDEFFLGGHEEGLKGGRQRGKKTLCGVAIEVRGRGSGRLRLAVLPDALGPTTVKFTKQTTTAGAIVHTDGLQSYRALGKHGYDHRRLTQTAAAPGEQLLPRAHRAISASGRSPASTVAPEPWRPSSRSRGRRSVRPSSRRRAVLLREPLACAHRADVRRDAHAGHHRAEGRRLARPASP